MLSDGANGDGDDVDVSDIRKNLLSELSEESPVKESSGSMLPPPCPQRVGSDKMSVYLRIRPFKEEELSRGENQVRVSIQ